MRVKTVNFAGKDITIRELKIKEISALYDELGTNIDDVIKANTTGEVKDSLIAILQDKLPIIFPSVTKEDIEEAYPSEIEELIGGFLEVNFTGVKKVIMPMLKLAQNR